MKDRNKFLADMLEKINRLWNNGEVSVAGEIVSPDLEPTGKKIDYTGVDILHIKDGKISKDYAYFDQVTILQQLGMMPEMG